VLLSVVVDGGVDGDGGNNSASIENNGSVVVSGC